jgi:hypothetical protein
MSATRRRFANFLDTYLQHYMVQRDQENQSRLVGERQKELGDINFNNGLLGQALKDPALAARLRASGQLKIGNLPIDAFINTEAERTGTVGGKIESAADINHLPTDQDIETSYLAQPGADPANRTPIQTLISQRAARDAQLRQNMSPVPTEAYNPQTHAQETKFLPGDPRLLTGQTVQKAPTPGQAGENQGLQATAAQPALTAAEVAKTTALAGPQADAAALKAKAEAKAQMPFQLELAQTRANIAMQQKQEYELWQQSHPRATLQERNKASSAITALGTSQEMRSMLEVLDQKGILGPIQGRLQQFAAGAIKSEDLINAIESDGQLQPDDARLVADYFSKAKLLASLAAVTHGGTRGGGSIQMVKQFEKVLSPLGDKNLVLGQLDALDSLMNKYKEHPEVVQPDLNIPGLAQPAPGSQPIDAARAKAALIRKQ